MTTISTTGTGRVPAGADTATFDLSLNCEHSDQSEAFRVVTQRHAALVDLLDRFQISGSDVTTSAMNTHEQIVWIENAPKRTGYVVSASVTVVVTDPSIVGSLTTAFIEELPNVTVSGPNWSLSPHNPAFTAARDLAASDARDRARTYAQALGLTLTAVLNIRDLDTGWAAPVPNQPMLRSAAMSADSFEPQVGTLTATASVEVQWNAEPTESARSAFV